MTKIYPRFVARGPARDNMMTFDGGYHTFDTRGNAMGRPLPMRCQTSDGKWVDSTGAFLVGELERMDMKMHEPLAAVTWGRDIDLREDVTIADEVSSFTLSTYAASGSLGTGAAINGGKAWIGKDTDQLTGIALDLAKISGFLRPWGMELKYTILELESAAKLGRPIDQQKWAGLQLKHQMDIDAQVYVGDADTGDTGLVNAARVTNVTGLPNGASGGSPHWTTKTPDEILADVNNTISSAWGQSAYAVIPNRLGLPPVQFGYITSTKVSSAGNMSILRFLLENNLLVTGGIGRLEIYPMKWLVGAGSGGTLGTAGTVDRMVVYQKDPDKIRFPMTMLQRTPIQYDSIYHKTTYFCRFGSVEVVYPETVAYRDGL